MRAINISTFHPSETNNILVDTNVLLHLFSPFSRPQAQPYSSFYQKAVSAKCKFYLSSHVYSEYTNVLITSEERIFAQSWKNNYPNTIYSKKSHWRSSQELQLVANYIDTVFKNNIKDFIYVSDFFNTNSFNVSSIVQHSDVNDQLIFHCTKMNDLLLLTDDKDMAQYSNEIQILTANQKLIALT